MMDVLREPRFDDARLAKAKEDMLSDMKRRNDETEAIEAREWDRLVYGDDYWINRLRHQGLGGRDHPRGPGRVPQAPRQPGQLRGRRGR